MKYMMRVAYLYLILINLLDYLSTSLLVNKQGLSIEANPILHTLIIRAQSTYPILIVKLIPIIIFGFVIAIAKYYFPKQYAKRYWLWSLIAINVGLTGIVIVSFLTYNNT